MNYILFAEDDKASRDLIRETLEVEGYTVQTVVDGLAAEQAALADRPLLFLLDVMLPGQSGLEVTRKIKAHYGAEAPPIILITALGSWNDIEQGRLAGADDYLVKPFSPEILIKKIKEALKPV